ncbi:hypothetical protein V6N12_070752 [Hibiscus sabdariffa]|uniref:Uncharacterized protein n=1 Tax=Hibiscus sabdariffa TaxID=183260 RepID=A0ABR2FHT4_9ROSI
MVLAVWKKERGRQKGALQRGLKSKWGGPQPKGEGPQPRFMSQETNVPYQIYMHMKTSVVAVAGEVEKQKELTVEAEAEAAKGKEQN